MGLFEKIFGNPEKQRKIAEAQTIFKALTAYQPTFTNWNGAIYESELVRSAIDARARHISKLEVVVTGSARNKLKNNLKHQPNDWQTWSQFLYRASTILDCHGTVFIVPVKDSLGATSGYMPVLPARCEFTESKNGEIRVRYHFSDGNVASVKYEECAILTRFQYKDDMLGTGNDALYDTMQLIHVQNQGIGEAAKNSATYRFMAQLANFANEDDLAKERKEFSKHNFNNEVEGGGLLLFPNTYKDIKQINYQPYEVNSDQMQLIRTNVYNYFGVNEDILQNKAFGDAWSAFYEGCVEQFAVQFSEAMTKAMFTSDQRSYGNALMATANRLQYMSNNDKLNVSAQLLDRGIFSINEVRQIWNLPPVDGGDARIIRGEYYNSDEKVNDSGKENDNGD